MRQYNYHGRVEDAFNLVSFLYYFDKLVVGK